VARTPRPLDPNDGPLEAFAFELRRLRTKAGEPTYRAMAKLAGFSATTLSEAAGGFRKPSLDVTLAFVGVCGGDVDAWARRWYALDDQLAMKDAATIGRAVGGDNGAGETEPEDAVQAAARARAGSGYAGGAGASAAAGTRTGADTGASPGPATEAASSSSSSRWSGPLRWYAIGIATAVGVAAIVFALRIPSAASSDAADTKPSPTPASSSPTAASSPTPSGSASASSSTSASTSASPATALPVATGACSTSAATNAAFSGNTYGDGANVRAGASTKTPVVLHYLPGCVLSFSGYCIGQVQNDLTAGSPDSRWFELLGGGVVPSATVHGNPPASMKPGACPGSTPGPSSITLSVLSDTGSPGFVRLQAGGSHVQIVGYAAYYVTAGSTTAAPTWHQLGLAQTSGGSLTVPWHLSLIKGSQAEVLPSDATGVPVVAVACLGGGGPTSVISARGVPLAGPATAQPLALSAPDLVAAERAACRYPA